MEKQADVAHKMICPKQTTRGKQRLSHHFILIQTKKSDAICYLIILSQFNYEISKGCVITTVFHEWLSPYQVKHSAKSQHLELGMINFSW